MNLGFDFDKIFIDYPPFVPDKIIDKLYKKNSNGKLLYRIPSKPEQIFRLITHHHYFRPPIKKNISFVKKAALQNHHKYYLISSRFSFLKEPTEILIKRHNLNNTFHGIHFNFNNKQPHLFKNSIIKKLKINRFVDDDLALLKYLCAKNKKTLFFWYNKRQKKKLGKNLYAITNLNQILK